jgi:hypothetical protein
MIPKGVAEDPAALKAIITVLGIFDAYHNITFLLQNNTEQEKP